MSRTSCATHANEAHPRPSRTQGVPPVRMVRTADPTKRSVLSVGERVVKEHVNDQRGRTLVELLCALAILGILAALYLGAVARAFVHIKKFVEGL